MEPTAKPRTRRSNAYAFFLLVLTIGSLAVMVTLLLPVSEATRDLLLNYDTAICFFFMGDFLWRLKTAQDRRHYFITERGWLDLLGSTPTFGFFRFVALFRLARISRLVRTARTLRRQNNDALIRDFVVHRAEYAGFVTVLLALVILMTASVIVLNAESRYEAANIKTGWDAFWWAMVTITTVGYGDRFPVSVAGRIAAMFVMVAGIGIIGVLASLLSSLLMGQPPSEEELEAEGAELTAVREELTGLRAEIASLREIVEARLPRPG